MINRKKMAARVIAKAAISSTDTSLGLRLEQSEIRDTRDGDTIID